MTQKLRIWNREQKWLIFRWQQTITYKDPQGERVENTQWHNLVAWNKTAEILEKYVKKGQEVAIEGKLTNRSYDDKEGNKRYVTEVVVNELVLLGKK